MNTSKLLATLAFAASKHSFQRRKDAEASPYINHPIAVANVLANEGEVCDAIVILAAILHDTVEDTHTTFAELEENFGKEVTDLVREVTDDKSKHKEVRKALQIEHAIQVSPRAKQIKIADKICNIRDIMVHPPASWSLERRLDYLEWSEKVVAGCRDANAKLDQLVDQEITRAKHFLELEHNTEKAASSQVINGIRVTYRTGEENSTLIMPWKGPLP